MYDMSPIFSIIKRIVSTQNEALSPLIHREIAFLVIKVWYIVGGSCLSILM